MRISLVFLTSLSLLINNMGFSVQLQPISESSLKWESNPALPKEIKVAILHGDPKKEGPLVMRLKIPANSKIAPHWHLIDENVTILSGSVHFGNGDKFNQNETEVLSAGGFVSIPPKQHHYAWFDEDTVVQLNNFGKWDIFYVNSSDDPRSSK